MTKKFKYDERSALKEIEERLYRHKWRKTFQDAIKVWFSAHEGKKLTKRIATDLQALFPGWSVNYESCQFQGYVLRFYNNGDTLFGYNDRFSQTLQGNSHGNVVSSEALAKYLPQGMGPADYAERLEKAKAQVAGFIQRRDAAARMLEQVQSDAEPFEIHYLIMEEYSR